jgi:hypothetical protein
MAAAALWTSRGARWAIGQGACVLVALARAPREAGDICDGLRRRHQPAADASGHQWCRDAPLCALHDLSRASLARAAQLRTVPAGEARCTVAAAADAHAAAVAVVRARGHIACRARPPRRALAQTRCAIAGAVVVGAVSRTCKLLACCSGEAAAAYALAVVAALEAIRCGAVVWTPPVVARRARPVCTALALAMHARALARAVIWARSRAVGAGEAGVAGARPIVAHACVQSVKRRGASKTATVGSTRDLQAGVGLANKKRTVRVAVIWALQWQRAVDTRPAWIAYTRSRCLAQAFARAIARAAQEGAHREGP